MLFLVASVFQEVRRAVKWMLNLTFDPLFFGWVIVGSIFFYLPFGQGFGLMGFIMSLAIWTSILVVGYGIQVGSQR